MKSILNVLYGLLPRLTCYAYDIKPDLKVDSVVANVRIRSLYYFAYLVIRNGFYCITIAIASACFHFYYDKCIVLLCNNIDFLVSESPSTVSYGVTMRHEVGSGAIFTD